MLFVRAYISERHVPISLLELVARVREVEGKIVEILQIRSPALYVDL